jgi:hypothetical protein
LSPKKFLKKVASFPAQQGEVQHRSTVVLEALEVVVLVALGVVHPRRQTKGEYQMVTALRLPFHRKVRENIALRRAIRFLFVSNSNAKV